MDRDHPPHLPGHVPGTPLRYHVLRFVRSSLLDASDPRLEPRDVDGVGNHPGLDQWNDHAIVGGSSVGRG